MRIKLIACKVMCREVSRLIADCENYIDVTFLRQGYHNDPQKLREIIQHEIDSIDNKSDKHTCNTENMDFDALLLGFGLCSNGTAGVSSKRYRIVMPRAHDCASILLGSSERYRKIFDECNGGVYWYSCGWIENCPMPCEETAKKKRETYQKKFGKDNAEFLTESEEICLRNYKRAAFIDTGTNHDKYSSFTKSAADYYGWEYREYQGDLSLLKDFLDGNWDSKRFLILPKNTCAVSSADDKIIKSVNCNN